MKCNIEAMCLRRGWAISDLKKILVEHKICSETAVAYWRLGKRFPNSQYLDMLCTLLDCRIGELFTNEPYVFEDEELNKIAKKGRQ